MLNFAECFGGMPEMGMPMGGHGDQMMGGMMGGMMGSGSEEGMMAGRMLQLVDRRRGSGSGSGSGSWSGFGSGSDSSSEEEPNFLAMMLVGAVMEFKKCFLSEMEWITVEEGEMGCEVTVNRETVQEDLETTEFAERIHSLEGWCYDQSQMITEETVQDMMEGEMVMPPAMRRELNRRRNKPGKGSRFSSEEEEEPTLEVTGPSEEEVMALAVEMLQNLAYFDCLHEGLEHACCAKGEEFFETFGDHAEGFLAGWEDADAALQYLPDGEIPPPLLVYFPSSGVSARPGQVVFTENVNISTIKVDGRFWCVPFRLFLLRQHFLSPDGRSPDVPLGGGPLLPLLLPDPGRQRPLRPLPLRQHPGQRDVHRRGSLLLRPVLLLLPQRGQHRAGVQRRRPPRAPPPGLQAGRAGGPGGIRAAHRVRVRGRSGRARKRGEATEI